MLELLDGPGAVEFSFTYPDELPLREKVGDGRRPAVRRRAASPGTARRKRRLDRIEADGYGALPVCVAKTQYSFSTDATLRGAPTGHTVNVREVRLSAGAGLRRHASAVT